jgi:hypothetical protein
MRGRPVWYGAAGIMPAMRLWQRWLAALVMALAVSQAGVRPAAACSCVDTGTPAAAFGYMPVVFTGQVTTVNTGNPLARLLQPLQIWLGLPVAPTAHALYATLDVTAAWKGVTLNRVQVLTTAGGGSCGFDFQLNQQYLVYGWQDTYGLTTSSCTRTALVSAAAADLAFLQSQPTLPLTQAVGSIWLVAVGLLAAALVFALGLLIVSALVRRGRRAITPKDNL